jgi:orotidine-5'-phosphate decarboxylase
MTVVDSASSQSLAAAERGSIYLARLGRRVEAVRTTLCLGVDPDPSALPDGWPRDVRGVERMANLILDAALARAAAVKVNVAFFEAFGSRGIAALERIRARVPDDVPFIADGKRGDIGTTVARQAAALYDSLDAHAVTANPYLGGEAIAPFLERADRYVYVLCRTSNPGAPEIQNLDVGGEPLYIHVARSAAGWARDRANVGLVVGATAPSELERIRSAVPELGVLVPGVGAQGGDVDSVLRFGAATDGPAGAIQGGALLVNVSRGISAAALGTSDPETAVAAAATHWAHILQC